MGQVALDECRELAARGHHVTVFTMRYPGASYQLSSGEPFSVVRLHPWLKAGDAGAVPQLLFRLAGFDLVHLHYPWYGGAEWVWLAKWLRRQRYLVTYHLSAQPVGWFKRAVQIGYDLIWARTILGNAEKLLVVDQEYFANSPWGLASWPAKIVELPNGVDTAVFQPASRTVSAEKGERTILFVGNLMPVKRLDLLLLAMRQLSPDNVKLVVVGGGYDEKKYQKLTADYGLQTAVQFAGRCDDREKLAEYYQQATCLVVPSEAESFSLVALEAMACGCPVIAADIPGLRARIIAGQDGFLFTPGSVADLVAKIKLLLSLSAAERRQMGERGRQKVLAQYSLEQHVNRLEEVYHLFLQTGKSESI